MKSRIMLSVIIPAYNAEMCIERAVQSVLRQSFPDIELIVVDDGSKDGTSAILDKLSLLDSRLKVVHQSNGGVGKARNAGLDMAKGEWIYFLDADDWIEPYYIQNFIDNLDGSDLVIQGFSKDFYESASVDVVFNKRKKVSAEYVVEMLQFKRNAHNGYLWHRLFRKRIIVEKKLRFKEKYNFAEDGEFFLNYMSGVSSVNIAEGRGHHYVIQENSLTTKRYDVPFYLEMVELYRIALEKMTVSAHFFKFSRYYVWSLVFYWIIAPSLEKSHLQNLENGFNYLSSRQVKKFFIPSSFALFLCRTKIGRKIILLVSMKMLNLYKKIKGRKYE